MIYKFIYTPKCFLSLLPTPLDINIIYYFVKTANSHFKYIYEDSIWFYIFVLKSYTYFYSHGQYIFLNYLDHYKNKTLMNFT